MTSVQRMPGHMPRVGAVHRDGGGRDVHSVKLPTRANDFLALHLHSPMAHYDIYRDRLATAHPAFGHALWEPDLEEGEGLVKIGDVGYIREGKFNRLFNALLPASDASHEGIPLPEYYKPLVLNVPNPVSTGTLKPNHYCSAGVNVLPPVPEYLETP